jgi:hypothetical protein
MTDRRRGGRVALPMAARQADCTHLPDVSFFRYVIFTDRNCSGNDRATTLVTRVSGQVKILPSRGFPPAVRDLPDRKPFMMGISGQFRSIPAPEKSDPHQGHPRRFVSNFEQNLRIALPYN